MAVCPTCVSVAAWYASRLSSIPAGNPSFFRRLQLSSKLVSPSLQTCSREERRAGLWNASGLRLLSHGTAPRDKDLDFFGAPVVL